MRSLLIDADAFICLHGLKLLEPVLVPLAMITEIVLTEYVARHEMTRAKSLRQRALRALFSGHESFMFLVPPLRYGIVHALCVGDGPRATRRDPRPMLTKSSPQGALFRELRKTNDKGEAESVAWALHVDPRPLFVTRDQGATALARARRVPVTDVMGVVVEACEVGGLDRNEARRLLAVWDDKHQQRCRPADYPGFDDAYAAQLKTRAGWMLPPPAVE